MVGPRALVVGWITTGGCQSIVQVEPDRAGQLDRDGCQWPSDCVHGLILAQQLSAHRYEDMIGVLGTFLSNAKLVQVTAFCMAESRLWRFQQFGSMGQKLTRRDLKKIFFLKDNYFTEFCCFLSNLNMNQLSVQFSSVQSLSHVQLFATPWIAAHQASLSITNSWSLLKLMSIESVMTSSHLILCRSLLLLPPIPPSITVFSNESTLCQSTGVSASASVLPMNTQESPLGWTGWITLQSKGLSRVFSNTTVQKHQFFGPQLSSQSNSHIHTWLLKKP